MEVDNKPFKFILPLEVKVFQCYTCMLHCTLCLLFMLKFFRVINFRVFHYPRKFFNNEIFPDYSLLGYFYDMLQLQGYDYY